MAIDESESFVIRQLWVSSFQAMISVQNVDGPLFSTITQGVKINSAFTHAVPPPPNYRGKAY